MPTASDLVTDLPADFETFGQAVATSMADWLGGTTGQVLSKASNTDMDFTWVTTDDANAIQNSIVDAKGDLIAATANDTPARLPVGANGTVVTADSTAATGLAYEGAWTTWNPATTGPVLGNGTEVARYRKVGKFVTIYYQFTLGSTSSVSASLNYFTLPFTQAYTNDRVLPAYIRDSATRSYLAGGETNGQNIIWNFAEVSTTYIAYTRVTATLPMTWTTGDSYVFTYTYEAA